MGRRVCFYTADDSGAPMWVLARRVTKRLQFGLIVAMRALYKLGPEELYPFGRYYFVRRGSFRSARESII